MKQLPDTTGPPGQFFTGFHGDNCVTNLYNCEERRINQDDDNPNYPRAWMNLEPGQELSCVQVSINPSVLCASFSPSWTSSRLCAGQYLSISGQEPQDGPETPVHPD